MRWFFRVPVLVVTASGLLCGRQVGGTIRATLDIDYTCTVDQSCTEEE